MSVTNPGSDLRANLIARVKGILLKPKEEWAKIEPETATTQTLYTHYVLILAAVPVICGFIGGVVFGYGAFGFSYHPSIGSALTSAIVRYVLTLVGVFVWALIIDALAPTFGSQKNQIQALKLAVYSGTAGWVASCVMIFPPLGILSLAGLYGLYLFYVGLPVMMKTPQDKVLPYMATVIVAGIVVYVVIFLIVGAIAPRPHIGLGSASSGTVAGQFKLPGGGSVDLGKLQQAANTLEQAAQQAQQSTTAITPSGGGTSSGADASSSGSGTSSGAAPTMTLIDAERLKTFLPAGLPGGYQRGEISTASGGLAGVGGSDANADYKRGDSTINLSVTDMGALGAMASMAGAFGGNAAEQSPTHYSKVGNVDGRMTMEEYNSEDKSGTYSIMVGGRVMVAAKGNNAAMDDLKSAIATLNLHDIEALAK
jgi:Yip1 domain